MNISAEYLWISLTCSHISITYLHYFVVCVTFHVPINSYVKITNMKDPFWYIKRSSHMDSHQSYFWCGHHSHLWPHHLIKPHYLFRNRGLQLTLLIISLVLLYNFVQNSIIEKKLYIFERNIWDRTIIWALLRICISPSHQILSASLFS